MVEIDKRQLILRKMVRALVQLAVGAEKTTNPLALQI
jgi:hypothetical protein